MRSYREKRILKEIKTLNEEKEIQQIELLQVHPQLKSATFAFTGPISSPYEQYWFRVLVQWPEGYPTTAPPKLTLLDKIWNPYVDFEKNTVCIDILKDEYNPALTTVQIILSVISLLGQQKINEDHDGFVNPKAASQMMNNYPFFCQQARKICETHSFKTKKVFEENQRGRGEDHYIKAEGNKLEQLVENESKDPKFNKKVKEPKEQNKEQEQQNQIEIVQIEHQIKQMQISEANGNEGPFEKAQF